MNIIAEEKYIKRIATKTIYDGFMAKRFEALVAAVPKLLDVNFISAENRFKVLEALGITPVSQEIFENITPTVGFAQLTKALTNNIASPAEIAVNYHAYGTSNTAPAAGNTQLGSESGRKAITSLAYSGNKAFYTIFYTASEAVGTFAEVGLFINGTGTANSGSLWDRSLLAFTKTALQTMTIDYEDTFSNV